MNTKVELNFDLSIPQLLQGDIHALLTECGYELTSQDHFAARYQHLDRVLSFNLNTVLFQLKDINGICKTQACVVLHKPIGDESTLQLLQGIGAVDAINGYQYTKTVEFQQSPNNDWFLDGLRAHYQSKKQTV